MLGLRKIAVAALACAMVGLAAAPAGADSRHDRRGEHALRADRGDDGGRRHREAYRSGWRDGFREAGRDERRGRDWRRRDDDWRDRDWRRDDDWRDRDWRRDGDWLGRDWRRDDDWLGRDWRRDGGRRFGREFGGHRDWRVGERPPRDRVVVIRDHRERRYPRPPRGAYYVSIDRDVLLVAAATGLIIDVLRRD